MSAVINDRNDPHLNHRFEPVIGCSAISDSWALDMVAAEQVAAVQGWQEEAAAMAAEGLSVAAVGAEAAKQWAASFGNHSARQGVPACREVSPVPLPAFRAESGAAQKLGTPARQAIHQCSHPWCCLLQKPAPAVRTQTGLPSTTNSMMRG